jgi:hypothetical protein
VHSIAVSTRTRGQHDRAGWASGIYEYDIDEDKSGKGECPTSGCVVHRGDKWRVMSNKDGSLWDAEYDTKKDADSGLRAYHASR